MKIISPLFIILPRKTKKDRKMYLNLNNYRNWYYIISNEVKKTYCEAMRLKLKDLKFKKPITINFILFKANNRKTDRSNILSIVEKFFCDAMVYYGCIEDDSDEFIESSTYSTGGLDKENPRVEIIIK